jgi:exosortase/archaeosortase family protein
MAAAFLIPPLLDYLLLKVLLASLAIFVVIFGRAARVPAMLVGVFGFSILFPVAVKHFFEGPYTRGIIIPLMAVMRLIGYPMQNQGQMVSFTSAGGEAVSVNVSIECAGPVTMAVFICLFVLMMLDSPRPAGRAALLFLLGLAGTWLQSLIRLVVLMVVGYNFGLAALWTAHYWTIYVLFPLWYLIFAGIYFRTAKRVSVNGKN